MKYLIYVFVLLFSFRLFSAELEVVHELELQNESGEMLTQVSGLAQFDKWIIVLPQDQDLLYYISKSALNAKIKAGQNKLKLRATKLKGSGVGASWEAVEFVKVDNGFHIFLSHEHDAENDHHQLFTAKVSSNPTNIKVSKLKKFGINLPLLTNEDVPKRRRYNYGYEAMVWDSINKQLVLLPELKSQDKVAISLGGQQRNLGQSKHLLRASDMTAIGKQCALVVSNCFASTKFTDALCRSNNNTPKLTFSTFKLLPDSITQTDELEVTDVLEKVEYQDRFKPSGSFDYYNLEGVVEFDKGFLLVNDNIPVNKAKTVLRYVQLKGLDEQSCRFK
jgi:hypothetical protein